MIKLTDADFKRHLEEQIHFLLKSARDYDYGDFLEAKRMSVALRVLLYDTSKSESLLFKHLGRKDIEFYDTSAYCEHDPFCYGLVVYKFGTNPDNPTVTFLPPLGNGPPEIYTKGKVPFNDWWKNTIIDDKAGNKLSREKLVRAFANKDGGAHVEGVLKDALAKAYANLINTRLSVNFLRGRFRDMHIADILSANIRQITYEVLKSLEDEFPEYFSGPNEVLKILEDRLPKGVDVTTTLPPRAESRNFVLPVSPKPRPDSGANKVINFTSDGHDFYLAVTAERLCVGM